MVYRIRFPLSMLALTVLAGCAQTSYVRTDLDMPATWQQVTPRAAQSQQVALAQIQGDRWWEAFGDAQLNQLQALALERNPDLTIAGWKVRNAWLTAGNAASNILPTLSAGGMPAAVVRWKAMPAVPSRLVPVLAPAGSWTCGETWRRSAVKPIGRRKLLSKIAWPPRCR